MSQQEKQLIKRRFTGEVVSNKMDKTLVVKVETLKMHKIYGKQYKKTVKFKVHDSKNEYQVGDIVLFESCRPMSKEKCWRVVKKVK